ncbi:DUF1376 domain-containing protein [Elizabethkingia meningoseptica]|uniref:DUF1376 domain-containing protein n=1 Tax=Elizabethkingia meningoseptica TaxID=238 RepID=UPI00389196D4
MKDPAFLFYTKDFISGTQEMSCEEVGAYLRLLMYQHQHGKIPNDKSRMMRICGIFIESDFDGIWEIVGDKFNQMDNHLVNKRMTIEATKRKEHRPKKIASATLAGLISSSKNLSQEQRFEIKKAFKIDDFIDIPLEEINIKVKEWFNTEVTKLVNQMVNNLVNVNEDVNENENENIISNNSTSNIEKAKNFLKNEQQIQMDRLKMQHKLSNDQLNSKIDEFVEKKASWKNDNWKNDSDLAMNFEFWLAKNPNTIVNNFKNWTSEEFKNEVGKFQNTFSKKMLTDFLRYYRQQTESGKMRFQELKAWNTEDQLKIWKTNEK